MKCINMTIVKNSKKNIGLNSFNLYLSLIVTFIQKIFIEDIYKIYNF